MAKTAAESNIDDIIFSIILISCTLLNFWALIHTIYKFYINPNKKISTLTKSMVITSIILLTIHCLTHTIFQLLEHSILPVILTSFICKSGVILISVSFYLGKSFLFCFYIIRAAISFKGSDIEYSNKQISFYCLIIVALGMVSTIGWPIIQLPFTHPGIDRYGNSYCIVSAAVEDNYNYHNANTYFLIYATLIEIIISIWTVWLFVGKLAMRSHNTYLYRKRSYRDRNSISITSHLSEDEFGNNDVTSLDNLDSNNNNHVQIWYESTKDVNKTLLIITKLLILLIISIITSQIALVLFLTIIPRAYGMDSCVNIYCIYLSLGFTNNIWKRIFCGTQCIRSCFPLIKMWTLTQIEIRMNCCRRKKRIRVSEIDVDDSTQSQDSESSVDGNMDKCKCSIYNQEQSAMHEMIRKEYKLFIGKNLKSFL